jgi:FMN reductase
MNITVLVGNPKADSRTLHVAKVVAQALSPPSEREAGNELLVVDLALVAAELFDFTSTTVNDLVANVAQSDLVVVASPTYKATYTGLLKAFLDRYGNDGLKGTVAVPVMTGAAPIHALAPEVFLRPLLVELGATVPARGLYVTEGQFDELGTAVGSWAEGAKPLIARALLGGSEFSG